MNIAIIGTGNVGRVLGKGWAEAGHTVIFGSRRAGASELSDLTQTVNTSVEQPLEAAARAEIVVLAIPWPAAASVIASLGNLTGKILVDCTNPLGPGFSFEGAPGKSGGEQIAIRAKGARVVKAFNSTGAKNMGAPVLEGKGLAMFICGDDAGAKSTVAELAGVLGFEAVDNGPLSNAHYLECLAMIWITQAFQQGWGPDFGFALVRR